MRYYLHTLTPRLCSLFGLAELTEESRRGYCSFFFVDRVLERISIRLPGEASHDWYGPLDAADEVNHGRALESFARARKDALWTDAGHARLAIRGDRTTGVGVSDVRGTVIELWRTGAPLPTPTCWLDSQ